MACINAEEITRNNGNSSHEKKNMAKYVILKAYSSYLIMAFFFIIKLSVFRESSAR